MIYTKYAFRRLPNHDIYRDHVRGKSGIEIGGPSSVFKGAMPLYRAVHRLDGTNFSNNTLWEGSIRAGITFNYFLNKRGTQFICDGTDLSDIASGAYEFVLSSNCLEHIANPIRALKEWRRVLFHDGVLILVIPNKINNFDRNRSITTLDHILSDFSHDIGEDDLTHLDEVLALHDLSLDPGAGTPDEFQERCANNAHVRGLHHHVFDMELIVDMLAYCGFRVVRTDITPKDLFAIARAS